MPFRSRSVWNKAPSCEMVWEEVDLPEEQEEGYFQRLAKSWLAWECHPREREDKILSRPETDHPSRGSYSSALFDRLFCSWLSICLAGDWNPGAKQRLRRHTFGRATKKQHLSLNRRILIST